MAERAGLRKGDLVLEINDEATREMSNEQLRRIMRNRLQTNEIRMKILSQHQHQQQHHHQNIHSHQAEENQSNLEMTVLVPSHAIDSTVAGKIKKNNKIKKNPFTPTLALPHMHINSPIH